MSMQDPLYDRVDALRQSLKRERRARLDAEHAAAKAGAEAGALRVEVRKLTEQSESWRRAELAWQEWARELLDDLGRQTLHGELGDGPARELIAQLAGMAPGVPRCSRCGCFATRHEVDDEELGACADCECTGYEG